MIRQLHILLVGTLLCGAAYGQTRSEGDSIRKAIEERRKLAETQKNIEDSNAFQSQENNFDLSSGRMYSQLLTFRYDPSGRDPFISCLVVSPFVTENDIVEEVNVDQEKIKEALAKIGQLVEARIQIGGVAYGRLGVNYAVVNDNQVVKPGEYLVLKLNENDQGEIQTAAQLIADAGLPINVEKYKKMGVEQNPNEQDGVLRSGDTRFIIDRDKTTAAPNPGAMTMRFYKNALLIKINKILDKIVEFETPGNLPPIEKPYEKSYESEPAPAETKQ